MLGGLAVLLLGNPAAAQDAPADAAAAAGSGTALTEIVVTAQKRGAQNLLKVPVPVAVVDAGDLVARNQVRVQDFANEVPGFVAAPAASNQINLSIRGINQGGQGGAPTVGVTIDDVPFGSSVLSYVPELDPGDLARVEVLRGPQGTLYGSDSMGGLLRFVTITPSTKALSGQVSGGVDGIQNGNGVGYQIRGSANVPVGDTLAVRVSAFRREEPGYIYDTLTNQNGNNQVRADGGRAAVLWRPSDQFSLLLTGLIQTTDSDGSTEIVPRLGDLTSNAPYGASAGHLQIESYSAVLNADLGRIHLTSLTGFNLTRNRSSHDYTYRFGALVQHLFNVPPYAFSQIGDRNDSLTQEVRLSTSIGHADVQLGGFYSNEKSTDIGTLYAITPTTGQITIPVNAFYHYATPNHLNEYAGFGDLTYHFTDRFDLQIGGRVSHIVQVQGSYLSYLILATPDPQLIPRASSRATPFTYLVTPRFQITPDIMVYARFASGYRPGGSNSSAGAPLQYGPDMTKNYEVGAKGTFFDRRLTLDMSLYYIDWDQIQIQLRTPNFLSYVGNGGQAKSTGVEFSASAKPLKGMTVSGWVDYDDAELTSSFGTSSPTYGVAGDRLPLSPRISGDVSVRQDFPVARDINGFVDAEGRYTGGRIGIFQPTAVRQYYPAYTQINLQAGIEHDAWQASVYVNNVNDARGQLNGGIGYVDPSVLLLIQPRTIGVTVNRKF